MDERVEGVLNVDVPVVMDDTLVLVELLDDIIEKGITVELLTLTDVTAEEEETVELAAILEDANSVKNIVVDVVEIRNGPFIFIVIVV